MRIDTINISHHNIFFLPLFTTCECVWTTFSFLLLFSPVGGFFATKKMQFLILSTSYILIFCIMGPTQGKPFNLFYLPINCEFLKQGKFWHPYYILSWKSIAGKIIFWSNIWTLMPIIFLSKTFWISSTCKIKING